MLLCGIWRIFTIFLGMIQNPRNTILSAGKQKGAAAKLFRVLQHNEARQQLMRRNAAKPGQGRERMRGQFAGYIPANRAEKFREAERS